MIWFGNLNRMIVGPGARRLTISAESTRMRWALERAAESAPGLQGTDLVEALVATGWVDSDTVERLLPHFRHFDPDRHFADHVRSLSFRGRRVAEEFRCRIRSIVEEIAGDGRSDTIGPAPCVRFAHDDLEGIVLAEPEVGFTISGRTREALVAAVEEMPDVVVVVARNFERNTAAQLADVLYHTGVPGTLVSVNLLLGIRAMALRYRPPVRRVVEVLASGGTLRSADIAALGERPAPAIHA